MIEGRLNASLINQKNQRRAVEDPPVFLEKKRELMSKYNQQDKEVSDED